MCWRRIDSSSLLLASKLAKVGCSGPEKACVLPVTLRVTPSEPRDGSNGDSRARTLLRPAGIFAQRAKNIDDPTKARQKTPGTTK